MAIQFILLDRDTPYILPPCVQDYLPEDHMARSVFAILDENKFSAMDRNRLRRAFRISKTNIFYALRLLDELAVLFNTNAYSHFQYLLVEKIHGPR